MSTVTFPADPTGRIDLCWSAAPGAGDATLVQEFLPDAGVHLVFRLSPRDARAVLLGPATERASVERAPGAEYLGIRFRAGQAPRLADVPSAALTDAVAEVTALGGAPIDAVAARLRALPDVAARQAALVELVSRCDRPLVEDARCRRAAARVEAQRGHVRVEAIAAEVGLSVRTLERRFTAAFGMTPKRMARLVRLRYVLGALHAGAFETLADLAHALGYADQAHLVHDFKALTGRVPGAPDAARSRVVPRPETRVVHRVRR